MKMSGSVEPDILLLFLVLLLEFPVVTLGALVLVPAYLLGSRLLERLLDSLDIVDLALLAHMLVYKVKHGLLAGLESLEELVF